MRSNSRDFHVFFLDSEEKLLPDSLLITICPTQQTLNDLHPISHFPTLVARADICWLAVVRHAQQQGTLRTRVSASAFTEKNSIKGSFADSYWAWLQKSCSILSRFAHFTLWMWSRHGSWPKRWAGTFVMPMRALLTCQDNELWEIDRNRQKLFLATEWDHFSWNLISLYQ